MTFHEYFANFSLWFWVQIANHLWQSTLFFLLIMISLLLLQKSTAEMRFVVWVIASVKFVLPLAAFTALGVWLDIGRLFPVLPAQVEYIASTSLINIIPLDAVNDGISTTVPAIEYVSAHDEIYCVLTLVWGGVVLCLLGMWQMRSRDFKVLLTENPILPPSGRELRLLKNAQIRTGSNTQVNFIISDSIPQPTLYGIWKPTIVIPSGLSKNFTDDEFELILMHELVHITRRDNLVGVLQMALCCFLWFHPLIWLIKRKLLEEREGACDEAVILKHQGKTDNYISGLLKVIRFGLNSQQSAGLSNTSGAHLKKRMELIMKNKPENTISKWQQWIVGSTAAALILACLVTSLVTVQADSMADSTKLFNELTIEGQQRSNRYKIEVYAEGKLIQTFEMLPPKAGQPVFGYGTYDVPQGQQSQTISGQRIYAFEIEIVLTEDSAKVEIAALLEDPKTVSDAHPFSDFKKQSVASYNIRGGESITVSEMSRFGIKPLELKVIKLPALQTNNTGKEDVIRQIQSLPNISYRVVGNEDSPLKITEAGGKEISASMYTTLTGAPTTLSKVYSAPVVKMVNTSGKTITGLLIAVQKDGQGQTSSNGKWRGILQGTVVKGYKPISIAPGATYIVDFTYSKSLDAEDHWLDFVNPSSFYLRVAKVSFEDKTIWTAKDSQ